MSLLRDLSRWRGLTPLRRVVLDRRPPLDPGRLERWRAEPTPPGAVVLAGDSLADEFSPAPGLLDPRPAERDGPRAARAHRRDAQRRPSGLILWTGANDVVRGRAPDVFAAQYDALLAECRRALPETRIAALGLPPMAPWRTPVRGVCAFNDKFGNWRPGMACYSWGSSTPWRRTGEIRSQV